MINLLYDDKCAKGISEYFIQVHERDRPQMKDDEHKRVIEEESKVILSISICVYLCQKKRFVRRNVAVRYEM